MDKKYSKILTVVLVVVAAIATVALVFWGVDTYRRYYGADKDAKAEANAIQKEMIIKGGNNVNPNGQPLNQIMLDINASLENATGESQTDSKLATRTYKGFPVLGTIEIPSINLNYPILDRATKPSMEVSVGVAYGPGPNKVGNTVIMGHNYRDRTFFSNLKDVKDKDAVYITDNSGARVKYTVYNIYETGSSDFDYASRDTAGKREITLATCTDDVQSRLVIWARADGD